MYSNFEFIKEENRDLYVLGKSIESQVIDAPSAVLCEATTFLENLIYSIYDNENISVDTVTFGERCEKLGTQGIISDSFKVLLQKTFDIRNKMHNKMNGAEIYLKENKRRAQNITKRLFKATWRYYEEYLGHTNEEMPKYVPVSDFDKQYIDVEKCVICGGDAEFGSFFCENCQNVKNHLEHLNYFHGKYGYYQLFSAQDIGTLGYSKEELDELLPDLVSNNLLSEFNERYVINCNQHEKLQNVVRDYEEVERVVKKFYSEEWNIFQLRDTETYKKGELFKEPFVKFYEFVNKEFIKQFFKECQSDKSLKEVLDINLISREDFIKLIKENESPLLLSKLTEEFLEYRKNEVSPDIIKEKLFIDDEIYENLEIKVDGKLTSFNVRKSFLCDLLNDLYYDDALKNNNITSNKVQEFMKMDPEFRTQIEKIMNRRRKALLKSLNNNNGLKTALKDAIIRETQLKEEFKESTLNEIDEILKSKYYQSIELGDTNQQALESCEVDENWVNRWMSDLRFKSQIEDLKATILMKYLQEEKELDEALELANITEDIKEDILVRDEFATIINDNKSLLANGDIKVSFKHYKMLNYSKNEIKEFLSLDDKTYNYFDSILGDNITQERKNNYLNLLLEDYLYEDALKESGLTIDDVNEYRKEDPEFKKSLDKIFNERQETFLKLLKDYGFKTSLKLSGLAEYQIEKLFDAKNHNSFYSDVNAILKSNFIELRNNQISSEEALNQCEVDENWLSNWMDDVEFKHEINKINEKNLLILLKNNENLEDALKQTDISKKQFECFVSKGFKQDIRYKEFFQIYHDRLFSDDFDKFLDVFSDNNERVALKKARIDKNIFLYEIQSNEKHYHTYLKAKKYKYVNVCAFKGHKTAFKQSELTDEEFTNAKFKLEECVEKFKKDILIHEIEFNNKTPYQVVKQLNYELEDIYRMYFTGIYGGENEDFAKEFERVFIDPIMAKIHIFTKGGNISSIKALKYIKNDGIPSKLNEVGRTNLNNRKNNRNLGLKRSSMPNIRNVNSDGINMDLTLSDKDYKLWKKYKILESYNFRSVNINTINLPDMASC